MKVTIKFRTWSWVPQLQKLIQQILGDSYYCCNYKMEAKEQPQTRTVHLEARWTPINAPVSNSKIKIEYTDIIGILYPEYVCPAKMTIEGMRGSIQDIFIPELKDAGFDIPRLIDGNEFSVAVDTSRPEVNWWLRTPENGKFQ